MSDAHTNVSAASRGTAPRRRRRRPLISRVVRWLAALACATSAHGLDAGRGRAVAQTPTPTPGVQRPAKAADMVAVSEGPATTIYLVDSRPGGLYFYTLTAGTPERIDFGLFNRVPGGRDLLKPTALAYGGGKLYVCDEDAAAVFELDLKSNNEWKKIIGAPDLADPVSIAVSDGGTIAVGEDSGDRILLFEPQQGKEGVEGYKGRIVGREYNDPERLSFYGLSLFVLDRKGWRVSFVDGISEMRERNVDELNRLLKNIKSDFAEVKDFAYYRGIFYVADERRVTAFTPASSHRSFPIYREGTKRLPRSSQTRITAAPDFLLVGEKDSDYILKLPRPVPVSVNVEPSPNTPPEKLIPLQRDALLSLYEYLSKQDALPRRIFTAQHDYASLLELLLEEQVFIRRPKGAAALERSIVSDRRAADLICSLNTGFCGAGDSLSKPVPSNQRLVLPDVPAEVDITTNDYSLGTKTVQEALSELVVPSQMSEITQQYLLRINRNHIDTLESELGGEGYIPVSRPSLALRPGTLIRLENGGERVVGDLANCAGWQTSRVKEEPLPTPGELETKAVEYVVPIQQAQQLVAGEITKLGITGVTVNFRGWQRESLDPAALEEARQTLGGGGQCAPPSADAALYVVDTAIRASGAFYKFQRKDGTEKVITERERQAANFLGRVDEDKEYGLIVDDQLYVGYTLRRVDTQKPASDWESLNDASRAKPGTKLDIYALSRQVLKLPATRWRLALFVNAAELGDSASELNRILSAPGFSVLSEERIGVSHEAVAFNVVQGDSLEEMVKKNKEAIKKNRDALIEKIGKFPGPPKISEVYIGVAENRASVHFEHPDFEGVWCRKDGEVGLVQMEKPPDAPGLSARLVKKFVEAKDHGNHVAGLIAARGDIAPGLIPGVCLYLIDTSNSESSVASIENSINDAVKRGVYIYNFSFTIGASTPNASLDKLKTQIRNKWYDCLFVAAAGNDGQNVADITRAPVSWGEDIPHIIGVGASNENDDILGELPNPDHPGLNLPGSNFGEKYVQLVAPGKDIFSTASEGSYALASGSSEAAPQVTAAAAVLYAQSVVAPTIIKARLIYTADWFSQLGGGAADGSEGEVWGGRLNFRRAVMLPATNLLTMKGSTDDVESFEFKNKPKAKLKIDVSTCEVDDPRGDTVPCPGEINFENVLRIQFLNTTNLYRVVYMEGTGSRRKMRVVKGATLSGQIPCERRLELDQAANQFGTVDKCAGPVEVTDIFNYVAEVPKSVTIKF